MLLPFKAVSISYAFRTKVIVRSLVYRKGCRLPMKQQAVAYYRASTKGQKKSGLGLEAQQEAVTSVLLAHGMASVQDFFEIESGTRNNRPVLRRALRYCKKAGTVLIFAKVDRFSRDALFVASLIIASKVTIITADKPLARPLELLEDAIRAQREVETIRARTRDALAAAKRRGVQLGKTGKALALKNKNNAYLFAKKMTPLI